MTNKPRATRSRPRRSSGGERVAARDDVLREQAHDGEHREPAVGELDGELAALERLLERLAEVARAVVAVHVRELRLEDADEEEDLEEADRRDLEQRLDAVRARRSRSSRSSRCGRASARPRG